MSKARNIANSNNDITVVEELKTKYNTTTDTFDSINIGTNTPGTGCFEQIFLNCPTTFIGINCFNDICATGSVTANCFVGTVSDISNHNTDNLAEGSSNLYFTNERVDDRVGALIIGGNNITATYDDVAGTLTLDGQPGYTDSDVGNYLGSGSLTNICLTGSLNGPATFTIDPAAHGDNTGTVVIAGNLQVDGTTTTINSTTLTVDDKNIVLASGSANAVTSDGAGITADLGSDGSATLTYSSGNDRWEMNKSLAASVIGNVTGQVSDISNHSTTNLSEGTNLYYTDTRVDARIAASPGDNQKVFVATGAISAGEVVGLRNDGTVEVISYGPQIENVGTPEHLSAFTSWTAATFDSSQNKVVIFYRNPLGNLYHGTAVVGTVDGTNITFGTPVVFNSANTLNIHSAFDSHTNKVVIAYRDGGNSSHGTAIVGTISGTSISFGTPVVFESSTTYVADMTFDSNSNKVVIVWSGKTIVGTVSGSSISFGTSVTYSSGGSDETITFDSNSNQVVIGYEDSTSGYGTAVVGTVSGTSITFGTPAVYESGGINYNSATFDSNLNKVVFAYRDSSNTGSAVVGTVSGTSISFGTPVVFNNGYTIWNAPVFDPYTNQVIIAYTDLSNSSYGTLIVGTVSGTSISFGSEVIFNTANSTYIRSVFDTSQNKVVITYQDAGNNNYIAGIVYTPPGTFSETNANSWIGIAAENIADTATGIIDLPGAVNRSQTGLTTNSIYYVDSDGSVTTTPTIYGKIGRAYSATELQIFESYKQLNFASHLIFGN